MSNVAGLLYCFQLLFCSFINHRDAEDEREGASRSSGRSSLAALKKDGQSSNSAFEAPVTHDVAKDPSARLILRNFPTYVYVYQLFKFNLNIRQDPLLRHLEGALPVGDGPLTQVWLFFL